MSTHAIHDFTGKLRQPSMLGVVQTYVNWRRAVRAARAEGRPDPEPPAEHAPLSINLDLTTACNYRCDHCIDWDILNSRHKHREEVLREADIAPVPGAPSYVLGIINLRGNVVSVLDTRRRFGLPTAQTDDATRIIIIESGGQTVGMRVDAVAEVLDVDSSEIEISPDVGNDEASRYISGMVSRGEDLIILIDVNKIIDDAT